jgi:hypothetical protein
MRISQAKVILCLVLMGLGDAALAEPVSTLPPALAIEAETASYSDVADLVVISPLIIDVTVRKAAKVAPEQAIGVPTSLQRMLIEADVMALIRGEGGIADRVRFVLDVPKSAKGKVPKLKKQRLFLFGSPVASRTGETVCLAPTRSQISVRQMMLWSAASHKRLSCVMHRNAS